MTRPILTRLGRFVPGLAGLALVLLVLAGSGFYVVAPGELAVVRRFGRLLDPPREPGLHWAWPLGIDRIDRVRIDEVRRLTIGSAGVPSAELEPFAGEFMTGDLNLVRVEATVQYRVSDPAAFVLRATDVEPILRRSAEASLTRALSQRDIDALLRFDRLGIARRAADALQDAVDRQQLGLAILGFSLTDARPPVEVAPDFIAAQAAENARDQRINDAQTYAQTTLTAAKAQATKRLETARASAERRVRLAKGQAQHFLALLVEAQHNRSLTVRRLYLETLTKLLENTRKRLVVPPGDSVDLTILGVEP